MGRKNIVCIMSILVLARFCFPQNDSIFFQKVILKTSDTLLSKTTPDNIIQYFNEIIPLSQQEMHKGNCLFIAKQIKNEPINSFKVGFSKSYSKIRKGWALEYVSIIFSNSGRYISFESCSKQILNSLGKKAKNKEVYGAPTVAWTLGKYSASFFIEKDADVEQLKLLLQIENNNDDEE
ncbi:MAG: hypothetical protein WBM07_15460 [Chitinivibrionales bacterium]